MRVFYWSDGFWPRTGGLETQGIQSIELLAKRGVRFSVLTDEKRGDIKEVDIYKGTPIRRFPFGQILKGKDFSRIREVRNYLESIRNEFKPDILHLNVHLGWGGFAYLLFRKAFQIPVILTVHAPLSMSGELPSFWNQLFRAVDQVCCVSQFILNEIAEYASEFREKAKLIYNGLSVPAIESAPLSFSPPILLAFGGLSKNKGFDTAIRAFSLLRKKGSSALLFILGNGSELSHLKGLAKELQLQKFIQFIGEVPREKIPSMINQSTIVIVPSYLEAFGLSALEAMQMGRAVIASNVGGLPEVVSHGETGLLVPPNDPFTLCKGIEFLLSNREKTEQMGIKGRKRALDFFPIEKNGDAYESLYKRWIY